MQLKSDADQKEKLLFEENMASNLKIQSKNEEFTKLSVSLEQIKSESQIFKVERDKLIQDAARMSQNEGDLLMKVQAQSKDIEKLQVMDATLRRCYWKLTNYILQEATKQHEITIKKMESDLQEERVMRDSIIRAHSDENQVPKVAPRGLLPCLILADLNTAGTQYKDGIT